MSDELVITPGGADGGDPPERHRIARRPRTEEARRNLEEAGGDGGVTIETAKEPAGGKKSPTPEEAVEASVKAVEAANARTEAANRRADEANREADKARATALEAVAARFAERENAITSGLDAAKAAKQTAATALKTAREAGDVDAEIAAQEQLARATLQVERYTDQKTSLDAQKKRAEVEATSVRNTTGGRGPSPEARRWLDTHPRYDVDPEYQARAVALHNGAITRGIPEGSKEYVDFIEERLTQIYGENHGSVEAMRGAREGGADRQRQDDRDARQPPARRSSSTAAPRGGGDGGGSAGPGARTVNTLLGAVTVQGSGRDMRIVIPPGLADDFKAGAAACRMSLADYALEQVKIAQERAGGRTGGYTEDDSMETFR